MQFLAVVFFMAIPFVSGSADDEKMYTDLVKIVGDFRNEFRAFNILIARSEPSGGNFFVNSSNLRYFKESIPISWLK